MSNTSIRPARADDRQQVLAFCAQTWGWGDYIDQIWDEWLHDTEGKLYVAIADEVPVGVVHLHMVSHVDAWLAGLRVHPEYRHQGIARALNEAVMLDAMQRSATHIRLVTAMENTVSIRLAESMHMRKVGAFANYTAPPLPTDRKRSTTERTQLATADDLDEIIDYLNVSNVFPLTGGLCYRRFVADVISAEFLEDQIAAQNIYLLRRWNRLDGLAIAVAEDGREKQLALGYIDGMTIESISLIAYDLRSRLIDMGLTRVRAYAPDLVLVHDAFNGIEYTSNGEIFNTYERGLV